MMDEEPIIIEYNVKKNRPFKVIMLIVGIILLIYVGISIFFAGHYTYGTIVAGEDISFISKKKVYDSFNGQLIKPIIFTGRHDGDVLIMTNDFENEVMYDRSELNPQFNLFEGLCWIDNTINKRNYDVYADFDIDEASFEQVLDNSILCESKLMKEPQNAYLSFDNFLNEDAQVIVKEGEPGNILKKEAVIKAVEDALKCVDISTKEIRIDLQEKDCYTKSIISTENAKLVAERDKANKLLGSRIEYDWNGSWIIVNASQICSWIEIKDNEVQLMEDQVYSFVEKMAEQYDTFGKPMRFRTSLKKDITINRGDYGWKTNVEKEAAVLIEDIKAGVKTSREPEYIYKGYAKGQNDVGRSYVEVDLSNQHVYLYVNGRLELETDCVTGNMAAGHKTPDGIYGITYKTTNATLRGPGYASFVYYWMPYCGGVGLHDATWRNKFGGDIYKTGGSHGCVNLPKAAAKQIYESVEKNFPVVTYW